MGNPLKSIANRFAPNPWNVFLLDGLGAILTTMMLIGLLGTFEQYFKMPRLILYPLSGIAILFALYSLSCYFIRPKAWKPFLIIIIIANILYCALTMKLVHFYYYHGLTHLGLIYFILEMIVVAIVVTIEITTLTGKKKK